MYSNISDFTDTVILDAFLINYLMTGLCLLKFKPAEVWDASYSRALKPHASAGHGVTGGPVRGIRRASLGPAGGGA